MNGLRILIENMVREYLYEEGRFTGGPSPHNSRSHRERNVGNPIIGHGNGSHSNQDVVSQVSTYDIFGAGFDGQHCILGDNKFKKYLETNFNNEILHSTMDFFGDDANGLRSLRREIDRLNGAAERNGRGLLWRTITPKAKLKIALKNGFMLYTFWEYSFNNGKNWYILVPNAIDKMKNSIVQV